MYGKNLQIQEPFRLLVDSIVSECIKYLGSNCVAIYLHGSIFYGDAIEGVSDLDSCLIISEPLTKDEKTCLWECAEMLQMRFPVAEEVHISTYTENDLKSDKFTRFILKYNAGLIYGEDIVNEIDGIVEDRLIPDKKTAKVRLDFAKNCFQDALAGKQPACTGKLPENTFYAARKFVRYFVVIEGAYWLMTLNRFQSFRKEDVLQGLWENTTGFESILALSETVLVDPLSAGVAHEDVLKKIRPIVEWMFREIETA